MASQGQTQLGDNADAGVATPTQKLRDQLSAFRFNEDLTPSLRRSPRNLGRSTKFEEAQSSLPTSASESDSARFASKRKRILNPATDEDQGEADDAISKSTSSKKARAVSSKKPKKKAAFAHPQKYAHLKPISDHLGEGADMLDVMFCGINPGQLSAITGHHFAHPTNHFWRCLHSSGLTDRLLTPDEDGILPKDYSIGITNLVERPSAQAAELAQSEFTAGVPALLRKIVQKRPRIVCFVGKGIWDSFIRATAPPSRAPSSGLTSTTPSGSATPVTAEESADVTNTDQSSATDSTATTTSRARARPKAKRTASTKTKAEPFVYDLQPYKIVHTASDAMVPETLFFVVVSTSGLVASHQLPDKIKQFTALKQRVNELKAGTLDTSAMTVIPIPNAIMA